MKQSPEIKCKLKLISKKTIIKFYLKSFLVGVWVLLKWLLYAIWSAFANSKNSLIITSQKADDYSVAYDVDVNKPPPILVDSRIGFHSYVKLTHIKFHYVENGNRGDPMVLLLHGFPDCWLGWRHQITELSRFFHVIAIDLKGFNDSDKPVWRHEYHPKQICDELIQFIQSIGAHSVTIIGHDLGAVIGWTISHLYPDNIDRLVIVSSPHPNYNWDCINSKAILNKSWMEFVQLPYLPEVHLQRTDDNYLAKCLPHIFNATKNRYRLIDDLSLSVQDAYKYMFSRRSDWTGPLNYYRNLPFYRISDAKTIRCPCLIITGSTDDLCRLEDIVKSTDYCDNYTMKLIENAGHWPHQEMPDEFNRVLLKFLVGRRAEQSTTQNPMNERPAINKSLVGRMFGAVSNTVNLSDLLDTVHHRTQVAFQNALK